jgi:hypothetical protein
MGDLFMAVVNFAFTPQILIIWGPLFVIGLAFTLIRLSLGKGYVASPDFQREGERYIRRSLQIRRSELRKK